MTTRTCIGVVAPSSPVPQVELGLAVKRLKDSGFSVRLHPQLKRRSLFFAGTDIERAQAFFDLACDPKVSVVWCARGGYGAVRLLQWLEQMAAERGMPAKKLLVGYSDITALMEFVRKHWGWSTLHGPMLGLREFSILPEAHYRPLVKLVSGDQAALPFAARKLKFITAPPTSPIRAEMVGGNLTVWTSLIGTRYAGITRGKILFFEDIDEPLYRVDRLMQQVALSGGLDEVKAIVLGTFQQCNDGSPMVLKPGVLQGKRTQSQIERVLRKANKTELRPLRPVMDARKALREIFGSIGACYGIPVAEGLPVGHGPDYPPLPLGAKYELGRDGRLELLDWDWTPGRGKV